MTQQQPAQEHRERLVREVRAVQEHYAAEFEAHEAFPAAVAEVRLSDTDDNTFRRPPVVLFFRQLVGLAYGAMEPGVILIWLWPKTSDAICQAIEHDETPEARAAIAAIASIEPHRPRVEL